MPNIRIINSIDQALLISVKPVDLPVVARTLRVGEELPNDEFPDVIPEATLTPYTRQLARNGYLELRVVEQTVTVQFDTASSTGERDAGGVDIPVKMLTSDGEPLVVTATVDVFDDGTGTGVEGDDYDYLPNPKTVTFNPGDVSGTIKTVEIIPTSLPHPAEGTGGTWWDAELTTIWDDQAGTDPAELTEGEAIKRIDVVEASGAADYVFDNLYLLYSPSTHATPNGKPAIYITSQSISPAAPYYNSSDVPLLASGEFAGRDFGRVMVIKRNSVTDNIAIMRIGINAPIASRTEGGTKVNAFGFISAFVTVDSLAWTNGTYAVVAWRWNASTTELEVSINGGAWQATSGADATWSPDGGNIQMGRGNYACPFDWYFDGDPDTMGVHVDFAAFIAAVKTYYGI
jgi:hypothetical protein